MAGGPWRDSSLELFDVQKKRQEDEEFDTRIKERSQKLESLKQCTGGLHGKLKKQIKEHLSYLHLKGKDINEATEKAKEKEKEVLIMDAKLKSLKLQHATVMERKQKQQRQIQTHSAHQDLLERTVKITKFDDVREFISHIENLIDVQDHFEKREKEAHEIVHQLKKSLLTLENDNHFQQLQDNNQLSQIQTELEKMRSETLSLEVKWNHIEEMAAKKTLLLGKIKMATFNLYEMVNDIERDKPVNINDTEEQLDKVKMFLQTYSPIVKHPTASQKHDGQEKDKTKPREHIAVHDGQDTSL